MNYLFVYGTLMRGDENHEENLRNEEFIAEGVLADFALYELGSYPGIVERVGDAVRGEVYLVSGDVLGKIDFYEDEGIMYRRQKVSIQLADGSKIEAWTYVYLLDVEESNRIPYESQPWKS